MEVHPPEHPLHTWKDFWIHLGTITVGLLIALALEDAAQFVHHRHQRNELEIRLHDEALRNKRIVEHDFKALDAGMSWLLAINHDVQAMRASGGKLKLPYRPGPDIDPAQQSNSDGYQYLNPSNAAWASARDAGILALLPDEQALVYSRLNRVRDLVIDVWNASNVKWDDRRAFEARFAISYLPLRPDLSRMSDAQLDEYSSLLMRDYIGTESNKEVLKLYYGTNEAVLAGAITDDELGKAMYGALRQIKDNVVQPPPVTPEAAASKP
ncbi:MAG: hypothetical protein JWQ90_93 [Hydrocarboniphaga sp.]|uniref:hypothetical protein n=1 Tax=Hydrocarboniphaga sp. TaxID=2033016 RepID=UPI0026094B81|nr:hypothetical protein [Hydrocarboniphaga sp.]MDB5967643.1 hypothetical protein [Hydrocarboniphaga sp.]